MVKEPKNSTYRRSKVQPQSNPEQDSPYKRGRLGEQVMTDAVEKDFEGVSEQH